MNIAATDAPYVSPIAGWVAVGCVVLMLGAFGYAFVTRYRRDWNALLREWSTGNRESGTLGRAPDHSPASTGPDGWAQSRALRVVFVGGFVLVALSFVLAVVFHSAGWVVLGAAGALVEGGAAMVAGLRS